MVQFKLFILSRNSNTFIKVEEGEEETNLQKEAFKQFTSRSCRVLCARLKYIFLFKKKEKKRV